MFVIIEPTDGRKTNKYRPRIIKKRQALGLSSIEYPRFIYTKPRRYALLYTRQLTDNLR